MTEQKPATSRSPLSDSVRASTSGHCRPVGCPAEFYDGLTLEQGLQVTRAFFAGMSAAEEASAETPAVCVCGHARLHHSVIGCDHCTCGTFLVRSEPPTQKGK